jgi:hypothetical protein
LAEERDNVKDYERCLGVLELSDNEDLRAPHGARSSGEP